MKKFYSLLILLFFASISSLDEVNAQATQNDPFGDIQILPNPVNGNTVSIVTNSNKAKVVTVFNVLGERVMYKILTTKELDITSLPPGVYVLRIKIGDNKVTKKLLRN